MIPAGTFNHFAADLGIRSAHDAVTALTNGEAVLVDVGIAGNRPFVNTSSTGIYVDLVQAREQLEGALGKGPAALIGLIQVLRRARPHELILDGRRRRLWLYFAGNCRYEPPGTAPAYRPDLSDGCLDIRVIDAGRLARSRLMAAVATGTLGRSRVYHSCGRPGRPMSLRRTAGRSGCPSMARWQPLKPASGRASTSEDCWSTDELPADPQAVTTCPGHVEPTGITSPAP